MLNDGSPVEPRPASTVLLARGGRPWEVLMVRRPTGAEFAPSAYVFPGGSVHPDDRRFGDLHRGAALRELFEEVGILLARDRRSRRFARDIHCRRVRSRLDSGAILSEALAAEGLEPAGDRLAYLTRWITPLQLRRRFDTVFYVARLPPGQTVHPQAGEVDDWTWVQVGKALAGGLTLVHATRRILETVADEADAARLIAKLRRRKPKPPVTPVLELSEQGWRIRD